MDCTRKLMERRPWPYAPTHTLELLKYVPGSLRAGRGAQGTAEDARSNHESFEQGGLKAKAPKLALPKPLTLYRIRNST